MLTLTKTGLRNYGVPEESADGLAAEFYRVYRQLCWEKHLNPIQESQGAIERVEENVYFVPGPRSDELTERDIMYCCVHATWFAVMGVEVYVRKHTLTTNRGHLLEALRQIAQRRDELLQQGIQRWGTTDPFPGKW